MTFDYSYLEQFKDPENWWLDLLTNETTKSNLSECIASKDGDNFLGVVEYVGKYGFVEPDIDMFNRS